MNFRRTYWTLVDEVVDIEHLAERLHLPLVLVDEGQHAGEGIQRRLQLTAVWTVLRCVLQNFCRRTNVSYKNVKDQIFSSFGNIYKWRLKYDDLTNILLKFSFFNRSSGRIWHSVESVILNLQA